jgi:hypothetical protein
MNFKTKKIVNFDERLDLLVKKYYGDHENYGLIGVLNRVISPSELSLGVHIKAPTEQQLTDIVEENDL